MRQFKFRAWGCQRNPQDKMKMFRQRGWDVEKFFQKIRIKCLGWTLMQWTGLKDKKNNKEIYEGDIVIHQNGFKYIVEFSRINAMWCLVQPRKKDGNTLEDVYTGGISGQEIWRCEVIGNIYENREIMKELERK